MAVAEHRGRVLRSPALTRRHSRAWVSQYQLAMVGADAVCGLLAGVVALLGRFQGSTQPGLYVAATAGLPLIWIAWQLFNVLLGEMSLVGPRPPLPSEAARYGRDVRRRLVVKPGLTGLWQVNGRSDLSREDAVRLDLRYVENWSFALDLQILWKTCSAVVKGRGAY
jgi:Bacterial sugar transferase